jgi:outer membrane protein assembly factor BamB
MKRLTTVLAASSTACLLVLAVAPGSAGAAVSPGDWAQRGDGPAHTSGITSPGGLGPSTVSALHRDYSKVTGVFSGIAVAGGVIYGTDGGTFVASSAADGHKLWSTAMCGNQSQNTSFGGDTAPAVGAGVVWISTGTDLTGIRLSTHARFACVNVGATSSQTLPNASATLAGDTVFASASRAVVAVNAQTGALRWRTKVPLGVVWDAPVYDAGKVFVPAGFGQFQQHGIVYALSAADGSLVWTHQGGTNPRSLAVADGRVYTGGSPGALDEQTGALLWSHPGFLLESGISVSGNRVFVLGGEATQGPGGSNPDGDVIAFNATTGQKLWETSIASEGQGVVTVGGGVVFATDPVDAGTVTLINAATGAVLRLLTHPQGDGFYDTQPVVVDGSIYLVGNSFDNGTTFFDRWSLPAP